MSKAIPKVCEWYGHEWRKNALLTSMAKHGYRIETCANKGCKARRRVWKG